ncbi:MAG: carbohydrate ABC transporter permease [Candidatus Limiplasma sp.]|nr:carbohydrate ABC transporter permease [Candidatus Limiplasma sp.]
MKKVKLLRSALAYGVLGIFALVALFPYFWMLTCAVRDQSELFTIPPKLIASSASLENFSYVLTRTRIPQYMLNTVIIAAMATLMCLVASIPAGYALARFPFRGRKLVSSGVILFKLLPQSAALIPLFILMGKLGLMDTHFGLSYVHLFTMVPFAIWMSRGFFKTVPVAVEEAALVDGCSKPRALLRVVLPITAPGLFSVGVYAFMLSWEEFIFSYTFTSSRAKPVSVGIALFLGEDANLWGAVMASAILMGLPVLLVFFLLQDHFIKGIVGGAVKG